MLHELPWLAAPTQSERDELRQLDDRGGLPAVARLAGLANRRWSLSELGSIGRKLRKLLSHAGGDWRANAAKEGAAPFSLRIFSSGTSTTLVEPLVASALARGIVLECHVVEYQEPEAWLVQNKAELSANPCDATLISLDRNSLRLSAAIGNAVEVASCVEAALDRLLRLSKQIGDLTGKPVILENVPGDPSDPQASLDAWAPGSPRAVIAAFNQGMVALAASHPHILFDVAGIADLVGQSIWHPGRYWYTAKLAFSPDCVPLYTQRLVTLLASLHGKSRRVLVLDLDNTLWGGVIGDDGVEGISLGGTSAIGSAHIAIQKMALQYRARGILLCVASKNTRDIALDGFRRHPEMVLRESDITLFEINWESKAVSISAMSKALNLGLEAFVFVDDNPAERKQVRDALPSVAVPELPRDPAEWLPVIQGAAYFEQQSLSDEDLKRAEFYKGNLQRSALQESAGDDAGFLESLGMVLTVSPFDAGGRKRIAQLIAKSNQFNLTTRRYSEAQIAELERDTSFETCQMRLSDTFGDNGMICVIICRKAADVWDIDTWLMSCRVLGRGAELASLNLLAARAAAAGASSLRGVYSPTAKNALVRDHYENLGFSKTDETESGETTWMLALDDYMPKQTAIQVLEGLPSSETVEERGEG